MGILMAIFGIVALLLCSVGLYGILAENVARRTHEFGIRLALGASPQTVLNLVLRHALTLAAIGLCIGLPLALALSYMMAALLFGIVSVNFPVLAELAGLLLAVAVLASYLPARRATRVDPMTALRYE
jgi:putative ABC transport system permease protein